MLVKNIWFYNYIQSCKNEEQKKIIQMYLIHINNTSLELNNYRTKLKEYGEILYLQREKIKELGKTIEEKNQIIAKLKKNGPNNI